MRGETPASFLDLPVVTVQAEKTLRFEVPMATFRMWIVKEDGIL